MALLDRKERNACLKELGFKANTEGIKDFQLKYMRQSDVDGKYGKNTDNALRTVYNVKKYTKNFKPQEFKCECGGRYCCGYPSYMKPEILKNIQAIRDHWGKPVTITSGLRCDTWNKKQGGSIQNSLHRVGQAVDFYQAGTTDTLANRKMAIKWIKTLPNHHYSYGNGINSNGYSVKASYMGNALHTDVNQAPVITETAPQVSAPAPVTTNQNGGINVDGKGGKATVKALQKFLGVKQDGVISGQKRANKKYYSALSAVKFGKGGSNTVKHLQKWLGVSQDGIWGKGTSKALQRKIGATDDGFFGSNSMKKLQKYLNANDHAVYPPTPAPTPTPTPSGNPVAATAEAIAWPKGTPAKKYAYKGGSATAAFKAMFNKVFPSHSKWGAGAKTGASCDVGVAVTMRGSNADPKFPRGYSEQKGYKSDKLQKIVYKNVKPSAVAIPGDAVLYTKNKSGSKHHEVIMGDGCFYEAQLKKTYFHKKTVMTKLNTSRPKVIIFRKK